MILFFDTETTGLPKDWKAPPDQSDNWPRVIQIAWILTEADGEYVDSRESVIKPEGFRIPTEAVLVHGISTEQAEQEGEPAMEVFRDFHEQVARARTLVAHNMDFDSKVMRAEFLRMGLKDLLRKKKTYCTMLSSTELCQLPGRHGKYKWPTLYELHEHLFGEDFEGQHDAMADIQACMRCYFRLKKMGL